jgi:[ribosomal protein S5]-alanine N-acetyltransferase
VTVRIPTLHTERPVLLPPSAAAEGLYQAFYSDAPASRLYGGPLTAAAARARLAADLGAWTLQGFGVWIIQRRNPGDLIGACGFWQGKGWPRELTWWLLPAARGTGLAHEASLVVVAYACEIFCWPFVETYMNDHNEAARMLALRLGGVRTGRRSFPDGLDRDVFRISRPAAISPSAATYPQSSAAPPACPPVAPDSDTDLASRSREIESPDSPARSRWPRRPA